MCNVRNCKGDPGADGLCDYHAGLKALTLPNGMRGRKADGRWADVLGGVLNSELHESSHNEDDALPDGFHELKKPKA